LTPIKGEARVYLLSWAKGEIQTTIHIPFSIAAQSGAPIYSTSIAKFIQPYGRRQELFMIYGAFIDNTTEANSNFYFLSKFKEITLNKPRITLTVTNEENMANGQVVATINLSTDQVAPFSTVETFNQGRFTDNGFLLRPGVVKTIQFTTWPDFTGYKNDFTVRSLRNTYL